MGRPPRLTGLLVLLIVAAFVASLSVACTREETSASHEAMSDAEVGGADSKEREVFQLLSPAPLPPPPPDVTNAFADNPNAAAFGRKLFFDPRFSGKLVDGDNDGSENALGRKGDAGKVACAGCHLPSSGFSDTRSLHQQISLGAGWGRRKAISLLDVGQSKLLTWDGRRDTLYNQVFGPIESPVEMNSSRLYVAQQLAKNHRAEYEALFGPMPAFEDAASFPQLTAEQTGCKPKFSDPLPVCDGEKHGMPGDGAEFDGLNPGDQAAVNRAVVNMGKAIAAYERLLSCGPSRFDRWVHGEANALDESEIRGARLFVGKARCVTCHSGPYLTDDKFHNVGLAPARVAVVFVDKDDPGAAAGLDEARKDPLNSKGPFSDGDDGRLDDVNPPALLGAMKTPRLRCASSRPSFMHTGQVKSLRGVIDLFASGGADAGYLGINEIQPLDLTDQDKDDLVKFLGALEGSGPPAELLSAPTP